MQKNVESMLLHTLYIHYKSINYLQKENQPKRILTLVNRRCRRD